MYTRLRLQFPALPQEASKPAPGLYYTSPISPTSSGLVLRFLILVPALLRQCYIFIRLALGAHYAGHGCYIRFSLYQKYSGVLRDFTRPSMGFYQAFPGSSYRTLPRLPRLLSLLQYFAMFTSGLSHTLENSPRSPRDPLGIYTTQCLSLNSLVLYPIFTLFTIC